MADAIPEFDLYRELEVDPNATTETIDAAWRSLAKRYHPDLGGQTFDPERIKRLNLAHDWLADPALRRRYDEDRTRKESEWRRYESHAARDASPGASGLGSEGTFSERWYGTQHAGHTDPAARAAAEAEAKAVAAKERRQAGLAVVAGIVVVVVALGAVGSFLLRPAPVATPRPPVTPNPTTNTAGHQERIDALVAAVTADDRTWKVEASVDLWLDGARGQVAFQATVVGADSAGTLNGTLVRGDRDWVVLGDRRWMRVDGGTWKDEPRLDPNRGWDPFVRLDEEGVAPRFLRWEQKATETYAQISLGNLLVLDPTAYFDAEYTISEVRDAVFVLDVDADGHPARGSANATVMVTDEAGDPHELKVRAIYGFSDVGSPLEIAAPSNG
jgi:hypothetical protein